MTTFSALSASTWGNPTAPRHVLLLHGIHSLGEALSGVGLAFASRGYFVMAPDLIGHGRGNRSSDYTVATFVEALRPYLTAARGQDHPYHIIIGHSLGGIVSAALLPLLKSTRPIHVVLIDPPFEQTPEEITSVRDALCDAIRNPKTAEEYYKEEPQFSMEDAVWKSVAVRLCDVAAVEGTLDQNVPWSFTRLLAAPPDNVKVTVLAADPAISNFVREEDLKAYPHVTLKVVLGASHALPIECPEVVVETALQGLGPES